ncbi:MAG TPA: hypothetical protein VL463_09170 [Kofleriaceae bacterium]|nr:hypothetical protein [Kofleriaceae bacterium]
MKIVIAMVLVGCAAQRELPRDARTGGNGDASGSNPDQPDADHSDTNCGAWQVGTLTGYNNSNLADDPNAGSVMEFRGLTDPFYDHVDMAAVDMSDWDGDKYHWIDVDREGVIGRVGVWDACANDDCPDGQQCCTDNKQLFAQPGYLVDVETRTAERLWGVSDGEDTLRDKIMYRVCGTFDPDAIAEMYGAHR